VVLLIKKELRDEKDFRFETEIEEVGEKGPSDD
jgi:hypothetical protein